MKLSKFIQRIVIALALGFPGIVMGQAVPGVITPTTDQTQAAPVGDPSPNDLRELMRLLADERVQHWLGEQAIAGSESFEADGGEGIGLQELLATRLEAVNLRVQRLKTAWESAGEQFAEFQVGWAEQLGEGETLRSIVYVIVFLIIGAGLEWLYWRYAYDIRRRIEYATYENPERRIKATFTRAMLAGLGITLFALGTLGGFLAFEWPPLVEIVVLNLLVAVVTIRLVNTVCVFILCPRVSALRPISLRTPVARYIYWWTMMVVAVICVSGLSADAMAEIRMVSDAALIIGSATGTLVAALLIAAVWQWRWRARQTGAEQTTSATAAAFTTLFIVIAWAMWETGVRSAMWTLVIVAVFPFVDRCLRMLVGAFAKMPAPEPEVEEVGQEDSEPEPEPDLEQTSEAEPAEPEPNHAPPEEKKRPRLYAPVLERLVRFVLVVVAVILLAEVWALDLITLSESSTAIGRTLSASIDILVAYLIADLIWVWARTAIDTRMADYVPPEPGHAPGPDARLATLLPLIRKILMVTLLLMVGLIVLSSLGVNVGPLLAGAGVVGIAIGFGAQTLVRDIVSGIFFLLDDAFRVGEYVEMGEIRGTVESISVRSLRLRHHRGMVHTIPFGEMTFLTNHSRDWVIMKLELRVPFETDLKLVKNLVNDIGKEMQKDPEYGHHILEPLKSQGVRRMEEFNMVVGVKFMARPGEQWVMRKVAYQKVRDAFDAHGINFAQRNVKVEVVGGDAMTEETRNAAMAAAQDAIEQPVGEPTAIPDEP